LVGLQKPIGAPIQIDAPTREGSLSLIGDKITWHGDDAVEFLINDDYDRKNLEIKGQYYIYKIKNLRRLWDPRPLEPGVNPLEYEKTPLQASSYEEAREKFRQHIQSAAPAE
jgi:hypothetical protein